MYDYNDCCFPCLSHGTFLKQCYRHIMRCHRPCHRLHYVPHYAFNPDDVWGDSEVMFPPCPIFLVLIDRDSLLQRISIQSVACGFTTSIFTILMLSLLVTHCLNRQSDLTSCKDVLLTYHFFSFHCCVRHLGEALYLDYPRQLHHAKKASSLYEDLEWGLFS